MRLTYDQARDQILEPTYLGYTQKSKDRLWVVMCFDVWSDPQGDPEGLDLYGNPIYAQENDASYDLWEEELVFTTRREAEEWAEQRNERTRARLREKGEDWVDVDIWMACNLGDLDRFDNAYLDRGELITSGKFRGSDRALSNRARFWTEYFQRNTPTPEENK